MGERFVYLYFSFLPKVLRVALGNVNSYYEPHFLTFTKLRNNKSFKKSTGCVTVNPENMCLCTKWKFSSSVGGSRSATFYSKILNFSSLEKTLPEGWMGSSRNFTRKYNAIAKCNNCTFSDHILAIQRSGCASRSLQKL